MGTLRLCFIYAIACLAVIGNGARAQTINLNVDSDFAEQILDLVCSGGVVDEAFFRSSPILQSQVKHHSQLSPERNLDAFLQGLKAAARCETLENDIYRFAPLVEEKAKFEETVGFFKDNADAIEKFVAETLLPYVPEDLEYDGDLVLSIVGNNCGGFSMDGKFFLALNCLRNSYEAEFQTALVIAAHETYHDLQYEFFYPFEEDMSRVKTLDDAFDYHFMNLMLEGTAEFVADSRQLTGSGMLTDFIKDMTRDAYPRMNFYFRLFNYSADILKNDDLMQRLNDVYRIGYSGDNGQIFYFVGAEMTRRIEDAYGRERLICILKLPPEQFLRAYHSAAAGASNENAPRVGKAMAKAADRLSKKRQKHHRFETCIK